jgi:iron complex outermembrane receptor protein
MITRISRNKSPARRSRIPRTVLQGRIFAKRSSVSPSLRRVAAAIAAATLLLPRAGAQTSSVVEPRTATIPSVVVVGSAPLPGLGTPLSQVPSNVQSFGARSIAEQDAVGIPSFLDWNAASVTLNAPSGNTFQPDVSYRGFPASPLLGTPQGLSVYQGGVRINEAFADVVHWDLIPANAIASMQLLPGSNAVFGLNTLGGALAVNMKNGFRDSGTLGEAEGGSFGRKKVAAEAGGTSGQVGAFAAGEAIDEDGWRLHSSTRIRRMYAQAGVRLGDDDLGIATTLADNALNGTQALPVSMLSDPRQAYTWPDSTTNRLAFVNASWQRSSGDESLLAANAYYRRLSTNGVNSNVNGEYDPVTSPAEAFNVDSDALTQSWGGSVQWTARRAFGDVRHQFLLGAAVDAGTTTFAQSQQDATFVGDRETVGTAPYVLQTDVRTQVLYAGIYGGDTIALDPQWTISVSGRYNLARVSTRDRSGTNPDIDGTSDFRRFNPAVGVTWLSPGGLNAFASVGQGMRVPTPVELTCADPAAPCTLPNIFVADPPLKPVISTTWEAGVRGRIGEPVHFSVALFRTDLQDDIQFIGAGGSAVNAGYFQNVGRTRRQGLELAGGAAAGPFAVSGSYSYLDATYRTSFVENSPNNTTASADGTIVVEPGDRLPGLPQHTFRVRLDWNSGPWRAGASILAASGQYSRGNENNRDPGGSVPGYAVVAIDGAWRVTPDVELFVRVDNLLDVRYQTFGILGSNYFRGPDQSFAPALAGPEPFRSPGSSFGAWLGLRTRFPSSPR